MDALDRSGQPVMQVPLRTQALRPSYGRDGIALVPGHQCQPSLFIPAAAFMPILPIGSAGIGKGLSLRGYAGSPARPETPISTSSCS
ncbi:hypothetical protein D9M68_941240 [compost metagenome]